MIKFTTHEYLFGMNESSSPTPPPPPPSGSAPVDILIWARLWKKKFHWVNQLLRDSSIILEKVAAASAELRSGRRASWT